MHCLSASSFVLFAAPLAQAADTFAANADTFPTNANEVQEDGSQYRSHAMGGIDQGLGAGTAADGTPFIVGGAAAGAVGAFGWNYKGTQAVNPQFQSGLQTLNLNFLKANELLNVGAEEELKSKTEDFTFGSNTKLHPEGGLEIIVEKHNAAVEGLDKQIENLQEEISDLRKDAKKNAEAIVKAEAELATLETSKKELKTPFKLLEKSETEGKLKVKPFSELKTKEARETFFAEKNYLAADEVKWNSLASENPDFKMSSFTLTKDQASDLAKPGKTLIEQGGEAARISKFTYGLKNPYMAAMVGALAVGGTVGLITGISNSNRRLRGAV